MIILIYDWTVSCIKGGHILYNIIGVVFLFMDCCTLRHTKLVHMNFSSQAVFQLKESFFQAHKLIIKGNIYIYVFWTPLSNHQHVVPSMSHHFFTSLKFENSEFLKLVVINTTFIFIFYYGTMLEAFLIYWVAYGVWEPFYNFIFHLIFPF